MRLAVGLPAGLGGIIYLRASLDAVAVRYDEIRIGLCSETLALRSDGYGSFLLGLARLLFSQPPYVVDAVGRYGLTTGESICRQHGVKLKRPRIDECLCQGKPIAALGSYVVLHTKVRLLRLSEYHRIKDELFDLLRGVGRNYQLVLLGEREVEYNREYKGFGKDHVYSVYHDLVGALPVADRTFPRLGITPPDLARLRQDCLTMRDSRASVHLGRGGAWCLALALTDVLCYHGEQRFALQELLRDEARPGTTVTNEWPKFRKSLVELAGS